MNEQFLDYLLDRLDAASKREMEALLQVDVAARRQLELLRQALAPLAWDSEIKPPPSLAVRTIGRVAEHVCRPLPKAPPPARSEAAGRPWWRRADVLVAASLLALFVGIGLPVVYRLRNATSASALVDCRNNLLHFHRALRTYEDIHKQLPPSEPPPLNVAGMIVPQLHQAGVLPAEFSVNCPGRGIMQPCSWNLDQVRALSPEQFAQHAPHLLKTYAFTLGYKDEDGTWHRVNRADNSNDNSVLVFADGPPADVETGNSANHGGRGQNVLFLDGHVQFLTVRNFDNDDIYLNIIRRIEAGRNRRDVVLGAATAKP